MQRTIPPGVNKGYSISSSSISHYFQTCCATQHPSIHWTSAQFQKNKFTISEPFLISSAGTVCLFELKLTQKPWQPKSSKQPVTLCLRLLREREQEVRYEPWRLHRNTSFLPHSSPSHHVILVSEESGRNVEHHTNSLKILWPGMWSKSPSSYVFCSCRPSLSTTELISCESSWPQQKPFCQGALRPELEPPTLLEYYNPTRAAQSSLSKSILQTITFVFIWSGMIEDRLFAVNV